MTCLFGGLKQSFNLKDPTIQYFRTPITPPVHYSSFCGYPLLHLSEGGDDRNQPLLPFVGCPLLISEYTNFVVPGLPARVGTGGSTGLESVQADALQISRTHHHPNEVPPQGDVHRASAVFLPTIYTF